ncbi:PREDICTED: transmembrane protein 252 [Pseudopodoces humilis]|uniref:transmembrane protein 252 n=1 Tax=Pseudopodoces humilis TaxID=181119 RepID=UPI0006B786F5|nr:PREDICTED: transmembrane protein 252 [Pseudopodoces humilis]
MRSTAERASKQTADRNKVLCLLPKMPKGLFTFFRLFMLLLSFSTICLGVLCMSTNSSMCRCGNNKLVFYCLLALGLCLLVTGIFWSTFHEILKYRALGIFIQNPSHREPHVCTIDRPDFYPPSYEDRIDPEKLVFLLPVASTLKQQEFINIPPPPYSESSAEFVSETNEQEQPPPYTLSVEQQQTADQDPNLRGGLNSHISMQEISCQQDTDFQRTSGRATPVKTRETGSQ